MHVNRACVQTVLQELSGTISARYIDCHIPGLAGLYIYGSVGSGKSLLMDMFYTTLSKHKLVPQRRRMHFNAAMLEVQLLYLSTASCGHGHTPAVRRNQHSHACNASSAV